MLNLGKSKQICRVGKMKYQSKSTLLVLTEKEMLAILSLATVFVAKITLLL